MKEIASSLSRCEIGEDRVIGGIHHPSDISAGALFADALFSLLWANEHFQRDFADARRADDQLQPR